MAAKRRKITAMPGQPRAIGHYSAAEVGRLAGVSARRVGQWARYGIIPSVSERPRVYSYADAGEAVLVRYLVEIGLKPREVRQIVEGLRADYGEWPLAAAPLKHDGKLVVIHEGRGLYISALMPGHEVIAGTLIDLKAVRTALERGGWVTWKNPREHIEVDPERLSGRPTIKGRRIPTTLVA
ncbi:MAG TPA: MerR family transcriptional regulator, partial [Gaiellaceae bacterium]|nr:MerR family transcriptional regulator [Gaiellaceae bacterium]